MSQGDRKGPATKLPKVGNKAKAKPRTPGENLKHVLKTGLPPGIEIDDAKDPGSNAPGGPVDNRS